MKPVTHLFQELVRDVHSQRWNEDELAKLSSVELYALTKLLSCPSSGVKQSVIVRLLAHRQLRFKLSPSLMIRSHWPILIAVILSAPCAKKPVSGGPATNDSLPQACLPGAIDAG